MYGPRVGGKLGSFEKAEEAFTKDAGTSALPEDAFLPYVCDALSWSQSEVLALDYRSLVMHLAYRRGKAIGEHAQALLTRKEQERRHGRHRSQRSH